MIEELEKAYLGWLVMDKDLIKKAELTEEMFSNSYYWRLYTFILKVDEKWKEVNMLLLKNKLDEVWILESVWWLTFITSLFENFISSTHFKDYEKKIRDAYISRQLLVEARRLKQISKSQEFEEWIMKVYDNINNLLSTNPNKDITVEAWIEKMLNTIEENMWRNLIWYSWWNDFLDNLTKWIRKWKTYRIWAPSWVWKTNLVYQTIKNLLKQWTKVLFCSLENSIDTTYIKLLSSMQEVNPWDIETWKIMPEVWLLEEYKQNLFITDQMFNWNEITRHIKKVKPDVVFLDYIWLVEVDWADERTLYDRYADLQKRFIQRNQDIAWIDLSNLNKDDWEERIRAHRWFNGSAKLRNNTDFAMHMFYYAPFYEYRKSMLELWAPDSEWVKEVTNKQAVTFLISKNRLWADWLEAQFYIDFNKWINYNQATKEIKEAWNNLSI